MKPALEWQRVSSYCIRAGQYRIAKVVLSGEEWFELHAADERLGMWRGSAATAKRTAQKHNDGLMG